MSPMSIKIAINGLERLTRIHKKLEDEGRPWVLGTVVERSVYYSLDSGMMKVHDVIGRTVLAGMRSIIAGKGRRTRSSPVTLAVQHDNDVTSNCTEGGPET